jgi:hypothetical protein
MRVSKVAIDQLGVQVVLSGGIESAERERGEVLARWVGSRPLGLRRETYHVLLANCMSFSVFITTKH